jgi:hypothetical protein
MLSRVKLEGCDIETFCTVTSIPPHDLHTYTLNPHLRSTGAACRKKSPPRRPNTTTSRG